MGVVVDTSALVEIERLSILSESDEAAWDALLERIGDQDAGLPAIVYAEAMRGVELAGNTKRANARRARLDALIHYVPIIDFDAAIAQVWASLFASLQRSGRMIPANDIAVAATAKHLEYSVLVGSSDERHFQAVGGLDVVTIAER